MVRKGDHLEDIPLTGEVPGLDGNSFREQVLASFHNAVENGRNLLPKGHGQDTDVGEEKDVSTDDLTIEQDGEGYKAKLIKTVEDHPKEIIVGLTVAGLLAVIAARRPRGKKKSRK